MKLSSHSCAHALLTHATGRRRAHTKQRSREGCTPLMPLPCLSHAFTRDSDCLPPQCFLIKIHIFVRRRVRKGIWKEALFLIVVVTCASSLSLLLCTHGSHPQAGW